MAQIQKAVVVSEFQPNTKDIHSTVSLQEVGKLYFHADVFGSTSHHDQT